MGQNTNRRADVRLGDSVSYRGQFSWSGVVVDASPAFALVMDADGQFARVARLDPLLSHVPAPRSLRMASTAEELLMREAVRDAIKHTRRADPDQAGLDIWNMKLRELTVPGRQLRPVLERYLSWDAYSRRRFEQRLAELVMLEDAQAQFEAYYWTVLGSWSDAEVATKRKTTTVAVRMGRMRARRFIARVMGEEILTNDRPYK